MRFAVTIAPFGATIAHMSRQVDPILAACRAVPPGRWAVGVSGGLDSTALLLALHPRPDLSLHVAHFNHELRGPQADADAEFVQHLAHQLNIDCTVVRRHELEPQIPDLPPNPSARYRALRLAFFAQLIENHHLQGVLLAHHADDQAETVLFRLLRGSGWAGLTGMKPDTTVKNVRLLRPLLGVRKLDLSRFLRQLNQPWREDASNASPRYARNRLRRLLTRHPALVDDLLTLQSAAEALQSWVAAAAPTLPEAFPCADLDRLPSILAHHSAARWLAAHGAPPDKITPKTLDRLIQMAADAAMPPVMDFPGPLRVTRRRGRMQGAKT